LDDLIRSKTDTKRAVEREIEALLSQKRGYVWKGGEGGWEGVVIYARFSFVMLLLRLASVHTPTSLPSFALIIPPSLPPPLLPSNSLQMEVNTMAPSLEIASESPLRSLVKACSWRFVAALITLSTSLFFSRE